MIEVKNLRKNYGKQEALRGISFFVNDGEILGFLGPNGAGKTTTMNILSGYIAPTDGEALVNGVNVTDEPIRAKREIGYLPEIPPLYPEMTADEYLKFVYELKKCKFPRESHLDEIRSVTGIEDVRRRVINNLSKGFRQRLGLAGALIGNPKTIILDEPTVGLDPKQIIEMRSLIKKLGKNHTVILSSHILSEVQAVCDKIVVINDGKIAADDTAENLSSSLSSGGKIFIELEAPAKEAAEMLKKLDGVTKLRERKTTEKNAAAFELEIKSGADIRRGIFEAAKRNDYPILLLRKGELSLEEIFLKLTSGDVYGGEEK